MNQVPIGKVIVNFKKSNYRGFDSLRFTHSLSVDSLNFIKLAELPPASVSMGEVVIRDGIVFPWTTTKFNSGSKFYITQWFYFSKSPLVSSSNFSFYSLDCCYYSTQSANVEVAAGIPIQKFYNNGFKSGDKIYIRIYAGNSYVLTYHKPEEGYNNYRFPTYDNKPSNVVSFTLP